MDNKESNIILVVLAVLIVLFSLAQYKNVHATQTYVAPTVFSDGNYGKWRQLETNISRSSDKDIQVRWQGHGGLVWMANEYIDTMITAQRHGKRINLIVTGSAVSMHALSVCSATSYKMLPGSKLVFHGVFYRDVSGRKVYDADITQDQFKPCVKKGIVSQQEVNRIIYNHDRLEIYADGKRVFLKDWATSPYEPPMFNSTDVPSYITLNKLEHTLPESTPSTF